MIAILSSLPRERRAFAALCESREWACAECDSLRAFKKFIQHTRARVVVTRHHLSDGYSDGVFAVLESAGLLSSTRVIVLLPSGTSAVIEARQVSLGADCIQRDPVRSEVLLQYLEKYRRGSVAIPNPAAIPKTPSSFRFAGAQVDRIDRRLQNGKKSTRLTPREIDLLELLIESEGQVVSYHTLFGEILGRRFRGDTSNLRVLLGLADISAQKVGLRLRRWVEVIPKLGYRYRRPQALIPSGRRSIR